MNYRSRCKDENSVKIKALIKRLLSTVVVCCRLLSFAVGYSIVIQYYIFFLPQSAFQIYTSEIRPMRML